MKNIKLLSLGLLIVGTTIFSSCGKKGCTDSTATNYCSECKNDDGSCQYNGQVIFWSSSAWGVANCNITVSVEGVTIGTITQVYTAPPTCTASGCVIYTGKPGTYNYTFTCNGTTGCSTPITGTVTVTSKGCTAIKMPG